MKTRCIRITAVLIFAGLIAAGLSPASAEDAALQVGAPLPPPEIQKSSRVLFSNLELGRVEAARDSVRDIVAMMRALGIRNLTPVAAAFIPAFDRGTASASRTQKRLLAEDAVEMAPDYPQIYFLLARARIGEGLNGIGPAAAAVVTGLGKIPGFPRVAAIIAANTAFYLQGVILILYIIGAFALLLRYFKLFRHDIGDLFPGTVNTHFTALDIREARGGFRSLLRFSSAAALTLTMLLLMVAPFLLGYGLLLTAALWMFISFPYGGRSERVTSIVATLVVAAVPLVGSVVELPRQLDSSPGAMRWSCINEYCPAAWMATIRPNGLAESPDGTDSAATRLDSWMAMAAGSRQWAGDSPAAIHATRVGIEAGAEAMSSPQGRIRYANILLLESLANCSEGQPDRQLAEMAVKSYETAAVLGARDDSVYRGLAVAFGLLRDEARMDEYLQKTLESGQSVNLDYIVGIKTSTVPSEACRSFNSVAAELRPPKERGNWSVFLAGRPLPRLLMDTPPRIPLRGLLFGSIPPWTMPLALAASFVIGLLLLLLLPSSRRAVRCGTCGHVSCPSCNRLASGFDHCPICLFEKVKPSFLDPEDVQAMVGRRGSAAARNAFALVMSIVIPGSGQVISGKPFRGLAMLMLLGLGVELVIFPEFPVVDWFAYAPPGSGRLPLLPPALLVAAWTWSVIDVLVSRRR